MAPRRPLKRARLLQTLLAVGDATEMAVAVMQVARFLPLITASVAAFRSVVVRARVYRALHVENALIFCEDEFALSDHKFFARLYQVINFVQRVPNCAVSKAGFFERGWRRLDYHTLLERLLEHILVPDQFGEILDLTLLI